MTTKDQTKLHTSFPTLFEQTWGSVINIDKRQIYKYSEHENRLVKIKRVIIHV